MFYSTFLTNCCKITYLKQKIDPSYLVLRKHFLFKCKHEGDRQHSRRYLTSMILRVDFDLNYSKFAVSLENPNDQEHFCFNTVLVLCVTDNVEPHLEVQFYNILIF